MPGAIELTKFFSVSKKVVYFDGDPMPYVMSVKVPAVTCPVETYNSTSTGGEVEVADPNRRGPTGDGEVKIEAVSAQLEAKVMNASLIQNMKISMAVNALNPQLGKMLPLPVQYTIGAQFFEYDPGNIQQGTKREITAKFKMMSYKIEQNFKEIVNFDFLSGEFSVGGADLLTAVQAIL